MFGDSRALFTDSNAIFSSNYSTLPEDHHNQQQQLSKSRMNFDMNNIQGYNKSGDSDEDLIGPSFKGLDDDDDVVVTNKTLSNGFALNSQMMPHFSRQSSQVGDLDNFPSSYRMENHVKMGSNLMRHNSSPAGLFSHITSQGYAAMRGGVGNYRLGNNSNGDLSPTASRLKCQMSLSSGIPSSLGMLSRISEIDHENTGANGNDDVKNDNLNGDTQYFTSEYPLNSWNESLHFAENFTGLKRELNVDDKLFSGAQNGEIANRSSLLSHHLSLPKTSNEIACMDKLLQYQDSVPCKIRAKRGCATHPRSIAERVRRTRISERMRKLQELVPHMDKQTNTADMLDLAVDYIKDLQKQFKILSDNRANCKCFSMQKQGFN